MEYGWMDGRGGIAEWEMRWRRLSLSCKVLVVLINIEKIGAYLNVSAQQELSRLRTRGDEMPLQYNTDLIIRAKVTGMHGGIHGCSRNGDDTVSGYFWLLMLRVVT